MSIRRNSDFHHGLLGGVSAITMVGSSVNDAFGNIAQVLPAGEADDGDEGDDGDDDDGDDGDDGDDDD